MSVPCDHVDLWLARYRDGELVGRARREAEGHIAECDSCRVRVAELDQLGELLRTGLGLSDAATDLEVRLERRVHDALAHVAEPRRHAPAIPWQLSAAAALVIGTLLTGLLVLRAGPTATQPEAVAVERPRTEASGLAPGPVVASAADPVVVRVLPSGRTTPPARVLGDPDVQGDADFQVVWIGEHEGPP